MVTIQELEQAKKQEELILSQQVPTRRFGAGQDLRSRQQQIIQQKQEAQSNIQKIEEAKKQIEENEKQRAIEEGRQREQQDRIDRINTAIRKGSTVGLNREDRQLVGGILASHGRYGKEIAYSKLQAQQYQEQYAVASSVNPDEVIVYNPSSGASGTTKAITKPYAVASSVTGGVIVKGVDNNLYLDPMRSIAKPEQPKFIKDYTTNKPDITNVEYNYQSIPQKEIQPQKSKFYIGGEEGRGVVSYTSKEIEERRMTRESKFFGSTEYFLEGLRSKASRYFEKQGGQNPFGEDKITGKKVITASVVIPTAITFIPGSAIALPTLTAVATTAWLANIYDTASSYYYLNKGGTTLINRKIQLENKYDLSPLTSSTIIGTIDLLTGVGAGLLIKKGFYEIEDIVYPVSTTVFSISNKVMGKGKSSIYESEFLAISVKKGFFKNKVFYSFGKSNTQINEGVGSMKNRDFFNFQVAKEDVKAFNFKDSTTGFTIRKEDLGKEVYDLKYSFITGDLKANRNVVSFKSKVSGEGRNIKVKKELTNFEVEIQMNELKLTTPFKIEKEKEISLISLKGEFKNEKELIVNYPYNDIRYNKPQKFIGAGANTEIMKGVTGSTQQSVSYTLNDFTDAVKFSKGNKQFTTGINIIEKEQEVQTTTRFMKGKGKTSSNDFKDMKVSEIIKEYQNKFNNKLNTNQPKLNSIDRLPDYFGLNEQALMNNKPINTNQVLIKSNLDFKGIINQQITNSVTMNIKSFSNVKQFNSNRLLLNNQLLNNLPGINKQQLTNDQSYKVEVKTELKVIQPEMFINPTIPVLVFNFNNNDKDLIDNKLNTLPGMKENTRNKLINKNTLEQPSQLEVFKPNQIQIPKSDEGQRYSYKQITGQKYTQENRKINLKLNRTTFINRPQPRTPAFGFKLSNYKSIKSSGGINVSIRRQGKFKTIGSNLSLKQALSIGRSRASNTLGRTIRFSGDINQLKGLSLSNSMFRKPTSKSSLNQPFTFIERSKFALSQSGEQNEIRSFRL